MASTLTEDHLTCTICYQPFREPKTLQCLHSFCHECIQQHINYSGRVRGFPCPVCRDITIPPDSMQPKSTWASQLKTDFKLKGILDAVNQIEKDFTFTSNGPVAGSEESGDELDDRKSQLKKLISISDKLKSSVSVLEEQIDKRVTTLQRMEKDKGIAEVGIKNTANAVIEEILSKEAELLENLWMSYDEHKVEIEQQVQDRRDILTETKDSLGLVDRLLSPGSEYATGEYLPQLQNHHDETADFLTRCSQSELPYSVEFSFTPNPSFEHTAAHTNLGVLGITETSGRTRAPMQFTAVTSSSPSARSQSPFREADSMISSEQPPQTGLLSGSVWSVPATSVRSPSPLMMDALNNESVSTSSLVDRVTLQNVLSTKLEEDEKTPYPCGIVVLDGITNMTVIVVVDSDNECVKSFYKENGQEKSHRLKLDNSPLCIAKLSCDKVVVGVLSYKLCVLKVSPQLEILSSIDTENVYSSLAILKTEEKIFNLITISQTMVITARDSEIESFVFKDNKLKHAIKLSTPGAFSSITSICATPSGDILVCDANVRSVFCLKLCGNVRWRYQQNNDFDNGSQTSTPTSATCDKHGNIYLVSKEDDNILKLAPTGDGRRLVATRQTVQSPMAIVTDSTGQLYVSQGNGDVKIMSIS